MLKFDTYSKFADTNKTGEFMIFKALFLVLFIHLAGCSSATEGSLLSDSVTPSSCPSNSCAQGVADPAETKVVLTTPISVAMPIGNSLAEISGECYPSLFPQNQFAISVLSPSGASLSSATVLPANFVPRCVEGRFYVPVSLTGQVAGSYTVALTFEVISSTGQVIRPPFKTVSATYFYRPQAVQ